MELLSKWLDILTHTVDYPNRADLEHCSPSEHCCRAVCSLLAIALTTLYNICLQAKNWIKELRKMLGEDIVVCIVGNKIDLEKNRTVSKSEAER